MAKLTIDLVARDKASSEIDKVKGKISSLTTSSGWKSLMTGVGVGAGVGAYNSLLGVVRDIPSAAMDAVNKASDLNETVNKSKVVFGDASDAVEAFASSAARSMGASKTEALSAAATFGNLFNTVGLNKQAAADMSVQITQLAGDLSSFNNIPVTEALDKLRSGLVGEAEPLRSVGVLLTEAAVAAKAVEMGLADSTKEVTEADKVQARFALILEQTNTAQGDFKNTSDGLANSQRILNAEIENLKTKLGEALLPAVKGLTNALADFLSNEDNAKNAMIAAEFVAGLLASTLTLKLLLSIKNTWSEFLSLANNARLATAQMLIAGEASTTASGAMAAAALRVAPWIAALALVSQYLDALGKVASGEKKPLDPWLPIPGFGSSNTVEGKATGGAVSAGRPYIVGEKGPELFFPGASGAIVPNGALGGGGQVAVNVTLQGNAIFDPYGTAAQQVATALLPGLKRALTASGMSLA